MSKFVALTAFATRTETELAKGKLAASGIKALIIADDAGGAIPFPMSYTYGARVLVETGKLEKSKNILKINK